MADELPAPKAALAPAVLEDMPCRDGVFDAEGGALSVLLPRLARELPVLVAAAASASIPPVRGHAVYRTRSLQAVHVGRSVAALLPRLGAFALVVVDEGAPLHADDRRRLREALPASLWMVAGVASGAEPTAVLPTR